MKLDRRQQLGVDVDHPARRLASALGLEVDAEGVEQIARRPLGSAPIDAAGHRGHRPQFRGRAAGELVGAELVRDSEGSESARMSHRALCDATTPSLTSKTRKVRPGPGSAPITVTAIKAVLVRSSRKENLMSAIAATLRPIPFPGADALRRDPAAQAFMLLRIAFIVAPILFGIDKFANVLTDDWTRYLAVEFNDIIPGSAADAMHIVGVVEIARRPRRRRLTPRFGGLLVAGWLGGIIVSLLLVGGYGDIALRDFGLLIGSAGAEPAGERLPGPQRRRRRATLSVSPRLRSRASQDARRTRDRGSQVHGRARSGQVPDALEAQRRGGGVRRHAVDRSSQHQLLRVGGVAGEEDGDVVLLENDRQVAGGVAS